MFPNLLAEMSRKKLTGKDVSQKANISYASWLNKMSGRNEFTRIEMVNIRNQIFPTMTLDYLFDDKPAQGLS